MPDQTEFFIKNQSAIQLQYNVFFADDGVKGIALTSGTVGKNDTDEVNVPFEHPADIIYDPDSYHVDFYVDELFGKRLCGGGVGGGQTITVYQDAKKGWHTKT